MRDIRETCWDHVEGNTYATYSSSERRWINKFKRDAAKYPEDVKIMHVNDDGSMVVHYPYNWIPMPRPKKKRSPMSDEQRQAAAERFAKYRESQKV